VVSLSPDSFTNNALVIAKDINAKYMDGIPKIILPKVKTGKNSRRN
jgi:hypothetical protein